MRLDWEPLQQRFWPAAVAEVLLGLVDGGKALALAEDKCLRPFSAVAGGGGGGVGMVGGESSADLFFGGSLSCP